MPQLRETKVTGVALVKHPANRRPFLLRKTADKEASMSESVISAPPADVVDAIRASVASVAKSESQDALEAIGRLAHSAGLSLEEVLSVAKAAGATETAKAKKDMPQFIKEKIEAKEDDEDEDEDEDDEEDDDKPSDKKKKTEKSAAQATATKGEAMPAEVEKAQQVDLNKAVSELRAELAKAKGELDQEREHRLTKAIKEELVSAFPNLSIDRDHLTGIVKSMRQASDKAPHDNLMAMLKAVDAQVKVAKASGGDITRAQSQGGWVAGGAGSSVGNEKRDQLVNAHIAKSGRKMTFFEGLNDMAHNDPAALKELESAYAAERN